MREFDPIKLASDGKKSRAYFRHLRWSGKGTCPSCRYRLLYYLVDYRFGCKRCRCSFTKNQDSLSKLDQHPKLKLFLCKEYDNYINNV